jgi:hypothetical protein
MHLFKKILIMKKTETEFERLVLEKLQESDEAIVIFKNGDEGGLLSKGYSKIEEIVEGIVQSFAHSPALMEACRNLFLKERDDKSTDCPKDENEIADIKIDEYLKHKHNGEDKEIHS